MSGTLASPDDEWIAIKEDSATPSIRLANIEDDSIELTNLDLPTSSYTPHAQGKTHQFSLEKWDPTSRYVLVKHIYDDDKIEWLVVDTQNAALTKNITTLFDVNASHIEFSNANSRILYSQIGADVRKIDIGEETISRPLITNVTEFSLFDRSTILYTTAHDVATRKRSIGYYKDGASEPQTVRTFTDDGTAPLHIAAGKYFSDTYLAIVYGNSVSIINDELPSERIANLSTLDTIATMNIDPGTQYLSTKTSGRFVVTQTDSVYSVYDLELKKATRTPLKNAMNVTKEIEWLDGYTAWSDGGQMLRIYEFDGANQHDIMPVVPGFSAVLSPDSKYLYGVTTSEDKKYHLERVILIPS